MTSRTVIDGNAFYEIDEDCERQKQREQEKRGEQASDEGKRLENQGEEARMKESGEFREKIKYAGSSWRSKKKGRP